MLATKKQIIPARIITKKQPDKIPTKGQPIGKKKFYKITKKPVSKLSKSGKSHILQEVYHNYTKYYPSILDPDFSNKIAHHPLFQKYKSTVNKERLEKLYKAFETNTRSTDDTIKQTDIFIHKLISKMLRNFISPYSPYRSLLIYHEMGVGKTCTAITIAESLKQLVSNSNTKIYVIRPDEFQRQLFNKDAVMDKRPLDQCTGDTYLQNPKLNELITYCSNKNEEACESLKLRVDKEIREYYKFSGFKMWAGDVLKEIEAKTKNLDTESAKHKKTIQVIQKMFNNSVIIIDEAHELRDSNEKDVKIITPVLNMVLQNASNVRLILLTATPIYDKPQNIISLINYFLLNDKRKLIREADLFDKEGILKESGRHLLIEKTRGYISFMRGNNPYDFPIRLPAKYNIPGNILNLKKYPTKDYLGRPLDTDNKIKYLELIDCPFKGEQLKVFNYHIKNDKLLDLDDETLDMISISDISSYDSISTKLEQDNETELSDAELLSLEEDILHTSHSKFSNHKTREILKVNTVAHQFECQMSNIIYQSLSECDNNLKLAVGDMGLEQIASKQTGKWTYEFKDDKYAKRFKLPELTNWSSKIAKIVEMAITSSETGKGPIFIYTNFVNAGAKPIAMALEMNGFKRYKMHDMPFVESSLKDTKYRGDYILYTGDASMSSYARDYINKAKKMIYEKSVKVFIGTSVASEGLNLFGYREVHILDPWHNINLTEQSIGRIIRTGSHEHLPPQERNVSVYQYASTLGERESYDLKIYRICESKAIKASVVEKILKENALDCSLNKDVNVYDEERYNKKIPQTTSHGKNITISLADIPFSRNCFYSKDCDYKCSGSINSLSNKDTTTSINASYPIMRFTYSKELEEYKNLIINLVKNTFNVNVNYLRNYLKKIVYGISTPTQTQTQTQTHTHIHTKHPKTDWQDEDAFQGAIQEIINMDIPVIDKFDRPGHIRLSGDTLRFIPLDKPDPNIAISKQYLPPPTNPPIKSHVDLKQFITKLADDQKRLMEDEEINYEMVLHKTMEKAEQVFYGIYQKDLKHNVKVKMEEIVDLLFHKMNYSYKLAILKNIIEKIVRGIKLTSTEIILESSIRKNIVYLAEVFQDIKGEKDIKKSVYGFIIQNINKLELFILDDEKKFIKNQGNLRKIVESRKNQMKTTPNNKFYGFLKYEKGYDTPIFKVADIISKGDKKSGRGISCLTRPTADIKKNINKLDDQILRDKYVSTNKFALCNDIEIILKRYDTQHLDGKKWFYTPEEYEINFGDLF